MHTTTSRRSKERKKDQLRYIHNTVSEWVCMCTVVLQHTLQRNWRRRLKFLPSHCPFTHSLQLTWHRQRTTRTRTTTRTDETPLLSMNEQEKFSISFKSFIRGVNKDLFSVPFFPPFHKILSYVDSILWPCSELSSMLRFFPTRGQFFSFRSGRRQMMMKSLRCGNNDTTLQPETTVGWSTTTVLSVVVAFSVPLFVACRIAVFWKTEKAIKTDDDEN